MAYKITYTPDYVKKDLTAAYYRKISAGLLAFGVAVFAGLLLCNRAYISYALEEMAAQLQNGESAIETFSAFYETLRGGLGG